MVGCVGVFWCVWGCLGVLWVLGLRVCSEGVGGPGFKGFYTGSPSFPKLLGV